MKKVLLIFPILFILIGSQSKAFEINYVNIYTCRLNPHGSLNDNTKNSNLGIKGDLYLSKNWAFAVSYSLENVPMIPDIKFSYIKMYFTGSGKSTKEFNFRNLDFSEGDSLSAKMNVEDIDLVLYYQPLNYFNNNYIKLETGVDLDFFESEIKLANKTYSGNYVSENVGTLIPSGYLKMEFSPYYNVSYYLTLVGVSFSENKHKLLSLGIKYYLNSQISIDFGYLYEKFKVLDVNDLDVNLSISGFYFGMGIVW